MNIEKTWGESNDPVDEDLSSLLDRPRLSRTPSHNPIGKIRRNLLLNIVFGVLICILYVWVFFAYTIWLVQICLVIVLVFSLWAVYTAWQQYRHMQAGVSPDNPLLEELKRHYRSINDWMRTQQRVALFIYPVSAAGGFLLGGVEGSGKPVEVLLSKPAIWIFLAVSLAVLVPACWYLARWMFRLSFGKHLNVLKANIEALESEK